MIKYFKENGIYNRIKTDSRVYRVPCTLTFKSLDVGARVDIKRDGLRLYIYMVNLNYGIRVVYRWILSKKLRAQLAFSVKS